MLQVLALTAMEPPAAFTPDAVRNEKAKALQAIRPSDP
jgi:glucose-6-phosphate 1-dehydrogenase